MPGKTKEPILMKCPVEDCTHEAISLDMMNHLVTIHDYSDEKALKYCYPKSTDSLVQAAKDAGAVEVIESEMIDDTRIDEETKKLFDTAPTTKEIIGTGKIEFHKELPQIKFEDLVGHSFLLHQIMMVEQWDGYYGTSNFGLLMIQLRDGRKATTLAGGVAVVKQLRRFSARRRFPVRVSLTQKPAANGPYYLFE